MSQPVPGPVPASVSYGKLETPAGRFHALYYLNEQTMHITSVYELAVGAMVLLERAELRIKLPNGHNAMLQFGPWGFGTCTTNIGSVIGGRLHHPGQRHSVSQADFYVVAGSGSIGRLWDFRLPDGQLIYLRFGIFVHKPPDVIISIVHQTYEC